MVRIDVILILVFLLTSSNPLLSQSWPKYYSQNNSISFSEGSIELYDKGYLISGNFIVGNEQRSWLIKTDINGNIVWDKIIEGGDYLMETNAVVQTMDGGIVSCGWIYTFADKYEPFIMKLNTCGEKEWCKVFTGSINDNAWASNVLEASTGDILLLMNDWGEYSYEDLFLFKLTPAGEIIWGKPICSRYEFPESAIATGRSINEISEKKYLISGTVYWEHPWNPGGPKGIRPLYVMVDSAGNEEWILPFGLQDTLLGSARKAIQIDEDTFIGVGAQWPNIAARNMWIMKFDTLGNEVNSKILDASIIDSAFIKGYLTNIQKVGFEFCFGGDIGPFIQSYNHVVEFITDTNIFSNEFSIINIIIHDNTRHPYSLGRTYDNKLLSNPTFNGIDNIEIMLSKLNLNLEYDTAYPGVYTYDSLCTTPGLPQSGFIFLDDCDIITGIEIPSPEEYYASVQTIVVTAYPNPAETEITLAFQNTEHHNNMLLECYNLFGQRVHSEKVYKGQQKTKLSIEQWQSGLYIAVIKSDERVAGNVRFVRR
jgi:hypothetical protein